MAVYLVGTARIAGSLSTTRPPYSRSNNDSRVVDVNLVKNQIRLVVDCRRHDKTAYSASVELIEITTASLITTYRPINAWACSRPVAVRRGYPPAPIRPGDGGDPERRWFGHLLHTCLHFNQMTRHMANSGGQALGHPTPPIKKNPLLSGFRRSSLRLET